MTSTTKNDGFEAMIRELDGPTDDQEVNWNEVEGLAERVEEESTFDHQAAEADLEEDFEAKMAVEYIPGVFSDEFLASLSREDIAMTLDKRVTNTSTTVKGTIDNVVKVISQDERFKGKIAFHTRRRAPVIIAPIDFGIASAKGIEIQEERGYIDLSDSHANRFRRVCEVPFQEGGYEIEGLSKEKVDIAIEGVAEMTDYDPVMDLFLKEEWDGFARLPMLFIDYLGAEDNAYNREAAEMIMVGLAARTAEPGCDFQHLPVLCGRAEGAGKSEFVQNLAGGHFKQVGKGDLKNTKEISVEFRGPAILLHDELIALTELSYQECNAFLQMASADVRLPYGKRTEFFQFPFVQMATTNDLQFLRTPNKEAGRRYSPIIISEEFDAQNQIANDDLRAVIGQIYAEAWAKYQQKRAENPKGPLRWKYSDEAMEIRADIMEIARAETDETTMSGLVEMALMCPFGPEKVQEIKSLRKWDTDYMEIDGRFYRRSWNRAGLLTAVKHQFPDNEMIQEEISKTGKGSKFKSVIDELTYISKGSSKTIHGLEEFGQQQTYKIDPAKFARILRRRASMAAAERGDVDPEYLDDGHEIPFE